MGLDSGKPFFAFLAFTAPHWPLQAPKQTIEKYQDVYSSGWQALRQDRFERMKTLGLGDSYVFYGLGWAQAGSVLNRYYKFVPTQGGIHAPLIARIPGILENGTKVSGFSSVLDITPTLLDLAGIHHPGCRYQGKIIEPPIGRSMLPYLKGEADHVYGPNEAVSFELFGHASVFMVPWKAVRLRAPWSDNSWALYRLDKDPGEQNDLSEQEPEQLALMLAAFERYKVENGVIDEPEDVTAYPRKPFYLRP